MLLEDVVSIKQHNLKKLITSIRFNDNLTKKDISNQTSLSIATVTNLCNELIGKGVVSEGDYSSQTRVGRTPNLMKFHYDCFYVLALDFQFNNAVGLAILNLRNEICYSNSVRISSTATVEEIVSLTHEKLSDAAAKMGIEKQIIGVGASVPAVYDSNDGLIKCSSIPRYQNMPLKKIIADIFGYPAYVDNCANLRAISAYAQSPASSIVCLDVSQGVGCGVVINGELLHGKNGYAAEIAHIPIGDPTLKCLTCSSYGCVETDLNVEHIVQHFDEINPMLPLPEKWRECTHLLTERSMEFVPLLEHWGKLLGQVTSILINLFDPSDFYVTGYITDIFPLIKDAFWKEVRGRFDDSLNLNLNLHIQECLWSDVYIGIADAMYHRWLP